MILATVPGRGGGEMRGGFEVPTCGVCVVKEGGGVCFVCGGGGGGGGGGERDRCNLWQNDKTYDGKRVFVLPHC